MTTWILSVSSTIALGAILWMFRQRYEGDSSKAFLARYQQSVAAQLQTHTPFPIPEYQYLEVRCTACDLQRRLPTMMSLEINSAMIAELQAHYTKRECQICGKSLVLWVRRDIVHHTDAGPIEFSVLTNGKRRIIDWQQTVYQELCELPEPIRSEISLLLATSEDD